MAESVLLIPAGAGQGPACPTSNTGGGGRQGGALRKGQEQISKPQFNIMQDPQWAPRGGKGWASPPSALGKSGEWCPPGEGRWGCCSSKTGGRGCQAGN